MFTQPRKLFAALTSIVAVLAILLALSGPEDSRGAGGDRGDGDAAPPDAATLRGMAEPGTEDPAASNEAAEGAPIPIRVRVVSAGDKTPVVGAAVEILSDSWGETSERLAGPLTTDGEGRIVVPHLGSARAAVLVRAGGFGLGLGFWRPPRSREIADGMEVELPTPVPIEGAVVDALTGGSIEGATVKVWDGGLVGMHTSYTGCARWVRSRAMTNASGTFVLPDFGGGRGLLSVEARGYATAWKGIVSKRHLLRGTLDLALVPAARIDGLVRGPDGEPLAGAVVHASNRSIRFPQLEAGVLYYWASARGSWGHDDMWDGGEPMNVWAIEDVYPGRVATADAQGRWHFDSLPLGGRFDIWASVEGHPDSVIRTVATRSDCEPIELRVHAETTLVVHVVGPDGTPVRRADICATQEHSHARTAPRIDGTTTFERMRPGVWAVRVTAPWHERFNGTWDVPESGTCEKTVVLKPRPMPGADTAHAAEEASVEEPREPVKKVTVRGRVLDRNGAAVADALITDSAIPEEPLAVTGPDGRFAFEKPLDEYPSFFILTEGRAPRPVSGWSWNEESHDVVLRSSGVLRIPIRVPEEEARPGYVHIARPGSLWGYHIRDEDDGVLELTLSEEDPWVMVQFNGWVPLRFANDLEDGEIRELEPVTLRRGLVLDLRVKDTEGRGVARAFVKVQSEGDMEPQTAYADPQGHVRVSGLVSGGKATITITAAGRGTWEEVRVLGQSESGEIVLPSPARLDGQILDEDGFPYPEVVVTAHQIAEEDDAGFVEYTRTDNAGRFRLLLRGGRYRLEVERPQAPAGADKPADHFVEVTPGKATLLTVELARP